MKCAPFAIAIAGAAALLQPAAAQDMDVMARVRQHCMADARSHCAAKLLSPSGVLSCLQEKSAQISEPCRAEIAMLPKDSLPLDSKGRSPRASDEPERAAPNLK